MPIKKWEQAHWWRDRLAEQGYFIEIPDALSVATWAALRPPLIIQGPPGSGKTALMKAVRRVLEVPCYWLTCYEGITAEVALYRWNEPLQRNAMDRALVDDKEIEDPERLWFDEKHLIKGKLAQALTDKHPDVMVAIDEVDKVSAGGEFENSLLEFTGDGRITVNEAQMVFERPQNTNQLLIAMTSNAGINAKRLSLSYPLLRRSLFIRLPEPTGEQAFKILRTNAPRLSPYLVSEITEFISQISRAELDKPLSIAESIMWVQQLQFLGVDRLDKDTIFATLGTIGKGEEEIERIKDVTHSILEDLRVNRKNYRYTPVQHSFAEEILEI
jgi:MoxR-like ATPase